MKYSVELTTDEMGLHSNVFHENVELYSYFDHVHENLNSIHFVGPDGKWYTMDPDMTSNSLGTE